MPVASGILPPATLAHPCASRAQGCRERLTYREVLRPVQHSPGCVRSGGNRALLARRATGERFFGYFIVATRQFCREQNWTHFSAPEGAAPG